MSSIFEFSWFFFCVLIYVLLFISRYGIIWRCIVVLSLLFFWFFLLVSFYPLREYCLANNYGLRWNYLEYYLGGRHVVMMLMWMPWLMLPVQMHSSVCRQNYAVHWTCLMMLQSFGPSPVQWYQDQHMVAQCISNESMETPPNFPRIEKKKDKTQTGKNRNRRKSIRIGDC